MFGGFVVTAFDGYMQAKFHGGTMAGGPTFTVIHDAETPLTVGYCDSIVEFFRKGPTAGTSAHAMVDPSKAVKMLPDNVVAYAAGPYANTWGWHFEQAGYASFTRAQWTTPAGLAQLNRVGACLREIHDQWGIPKRWMTDDQLRAAAKGDRSQGGMTTHQQIARVLGGTTHTDPETNYPRDLLLAVVLGNSMEVPDLDADQNNRLTEAWTNSVAANNNSAKAVVQIAALTELVRQLGANQGASIDMAAIEAVVEKGVADAIAGIETTVSVKPAS